MVDNIIREGILNMNKPAGMTSHDCVNILRKLTGVRRIGHTGTLDPGATGVLPLCVGGTARISEYLDLDFKKYRCTLLLGLETETQDIWGATVSDCREALLEKQKKGQGFTEAQIKSAFDGFMGLIEQYPPKYSAVRVNGKRLYQYARAGEEVEIKPRNIFIKECVVEAVNLENLEITFFVTCSKGTYIRAICQEAGEILGCGGAMSSLVRLASGKFSLEGAVSIGTLEGLKKLEEGERVAEINKLLLPADFPLEYFGRALVNEERGRWFCNGGHISMSEAVIAKEPVFKHQEPLIPIREEYRDAYNVYKEQDGEEFFLGVAFYNYEYKKLVADKVFAR